MQTRPDRYTPSARDVLAQRIVPTLHRQRWSLDSEPGTPMYRVLHLSSGQGEVSHDGGEQALRAPEFIWLPAGSARSLRVEAGSAGVVVGVSDALLAASVGVQADSAALRQMSLRLCRFDGLDAAARDELARSMHAIETEARQGSGGSWHYLAAQLTIVLVMLWRMAAHDTADAPGAAGAAAHRQQRIRHLVEAQFRDHRPVARYAAELSISADRLHDLCVRTLERTPLALVHQRLVREACLLLAGSDLSVERLAADHGFASASHFSRFFKRWMTVGPKAWRERVRAQAAAGQPLGPASYADWP
jgi:AraC-like DNA-binding protein